MKFNSHWALKLTGIIAVIFFIQVFFPIITELFKLVSGDIFSRPWILLTSVFLHGSLSHLLLNGFGLALFGSILENIIGSKRLIYLFIVSGILASIISVIVGSVFPVAAFGSALGASGAIFAIMGGLAVLRPTMTIWINFMPLPMWMAVIAWGVMNFFGIYIPDGIGNIAHLGGLGVGLAVGFYYRSKNIENKGRIQIKEDLMISKEELEEWERKNFKF